MPRDNPDELVQVAAPYAFAVTEDSIEFPGFQPPPAFKQQPAESWPLSDTEVEVRAGGRALRLSSPHGRTRTYWARVLDRPPEEVAAMARAHIRAGSTKSA